MATPGTQGRPPSEVNNFPNPPDRQLMTDFSNRDPDLLQSQYDFSSLMFPSDLDMNNLGHYMVINVNVPVYADQTQRGSQRTINYNGLAFENEYSKVDVLRFSTAIDSLPGDQNRAALSFPRATRRIRKSIALHMPTPMIYTSVQRFEEVSLTAMMGQGLGALAGGLAGALTQYASGILGLGTEVAAGVRQLLDGAGKMVGVASAMTGYPINPRVEILFSNTDQRQFAFEVMMAPHNREESIAVREIVKALRFYSAPELTTDVTGFIPLYIPPAEFDITFFTRGIENTNIPRINTCVLERIEVDYAPTGVYATFSNGHPVAVRLSMGFREIEPLHKLRILQGF
jgi:hypothetical protein